MYNRKVFIVIASIVMSINNGLGAIFLPYFAKFKFLLSSKDLGVYVFLSAVVYVITALTVVRIERKFELQKSLLIFLTIQLLSFVSVFFIHTKLFIIVPFLLAGIAQGGWWPLVEGAMCEGQNVIQKKRAVAFFNFSWLLGLVIGPFIAGALYEINVMWPLHTGIYIILFVILLVLIPQSLMIAPWKCIQQKSLIVPLSLKYFIKLGIVLNLINYLFISSFRSLLVEFVSDFKISSFQYGIIHAVFNLGILSFMFILMKYDFWQFSKKIIMAAILAYIILLFTYAKADAFFQFIAISFLLGAPCALIYFSSLYYGMLGEKSGSQHGGYHEAMIGSGQSLGPLISGLLISFTSDPRFVFNWPMLVLLIAGRLIFILNKKRFNVTN